MPINYYLIIIFSLVVVVIVLLVRLFKNNREISRLETTNLFLSRENETIQNQQSKVKEDIENNFQHLANCILEEKLSKLEVEKDKSVSTILTPVRESIENFRKRLEEVNRSDIADRNVLVHVIQDLKKQSESVSKEASSLTEALRGNSKTQGDWGEMILERLLEDSGLKKGREFDVQYTMRKDGTIVRHADTGQMLRPDVVVHFPGERDVIIDSKVSLSAYYDYITSETDESRKEALKRHITSVNTHISELSKKDYSRYLSTSLEFVILFFPNEGAFNLAMAHNPNLWNDAYKKKVILMGPLNIIAMLRTLQDLWKKEQQIQNIEEIISEANNLYDKFAIYSERFDKIGRQIERLQDTYVEASKQLSTGRGNIVSRLVYLKNMGLTPSKEIADELLQYENKKDD